MSNSWDTRELCKRAWGMPLAVALLAVSALSTAGQDAAGSLTGKLTDLHSRPLDGVTVTLKNEHSGAEIRTITGRAAPTASATLRQECTTLLQ